MRGDSLFIISSSDGFWPLSLIMDWLSSLDLLGEGLVSFFGGEV